MFVFGFQMFFGAVLQRLNREVRAVKLAMLLILVLVLGEC